MANFRLSTAAALTGLLLAGTPAVHALRAQEAPPTDAAAEPATTLANPIASLISVPLQYNDDRNCGADDEGSRSVLNVQPIMPFSLGPQIFQISVGARCWAAAPDNGPEGFGLRIGLTFLFPR